ncbi:hypothetical protein C8R44DRAFT_730721 [Mycena epipterygia]|nr:hypothetical protein C8R44DRAFT_730721 [Mycena epipterygia]
MSFNNTNDNTDFGRDTGRTGGDYDNNAGSALESPRAAVVDQFHSSNTSGGYGQDGNMNPNSSSGYGQDSDMDSSSFGTSRRTDDLDSGATGGAMQGDQFGSDRPTNFDSNNANTTGRSGKVPMGDKLKGGAEKLAGKVMGNSGMQ